MFLALITALNIMWLIVACTKLASQNDRSKVYNFRQSSVTTIFYVFSWLISIHLSRLICRFFSLSMPSAQARMLKLNMFVRWTNISSLLITTPIYIWYLKFYRYALIWLSCTSHLLCYKCWVSWILNIQCDFSLFTTVQFLPNRSFYYKH